MILTCTSLLVQMQPAIMTEWITGAEKLAAIVDQDKVTYKEYLHG